MTSDEISLLHDSRLSREARIVGLHVASLGEGEHVVSHDDLRLLLGRGPRDGMAKDDSLAGYVQELVLHGWVRRGPGGRGSPVYEFLPPPQGVVDESLPPSQGGAEENLYPPLRGGQSSTPHPRGSKDSFYPPLKGDQTPPSSSYPLPPPAPPRAHARVGEPVATALHPDAERALADRSDVLDGCRGPLRDYLVQRVASDRQAPYVWRVVTALEGADEWMWQDRTGKRLTEGRTAKLAAAFNELMLGTEVGDYFPDPPGGFGNLRSKVRYLVGSELGAERDATRSANSQGSAGTGTGTDGPPRRTRPTIDISNQGILD